MYCPAYDQEKGLLVAISAGELTWSDHVVSMEALARLDRECASLAGPLVTVLVVEPDAGQPTAQMRKEYADAQAQMRAPRHLFLLVTTSAVVRGVLTAVHWIRPPTGRFHTEAVATFELAVKRAEQERGTPLPQLKRLLAEARRRRVEATGEQKPSGTMPAGQSSPPSRKGTGSE
jgi:hypothetical protein